MSEVKSLIFVFDRMPDQDGCTFIEVENAEGQSVCAGEWRNRDDGLVELVVPINYATNSERLRADTAEADSARKDVVIEDLMQSNSDMTTCLAAAEQRIAELLVMLRQAWVDDHVSAADCRKIDAALNPNPEAESHE